MSANHSEVGILWLVLDDASKGVLRQHMPPRFSKEFYDHQTLRYGVMRSEVTEWIGRQYTTVVYVVAWNDQVQAARVLASDLPDEYGVPHITLSTTKGTAPYASVAMLQSAHTEKTTTPITLTGTIAFKTLSTIRD